MLFANNCNTTLNGGITAVATSMVVTSATGFPVPTGSQYFYCTLADAATQTTIEIVKVTAVSGTTFTIVRGQDGTTGTIFASGAVVSLRLVRASLNDFPKLDEDNTFTGSNAYGTPASITLTNGTNLPIVGGTTGTLTTGRGGTGLTSFTNAGVLYASSTSALTTSSAFAFDGANLGVSGKGYFGTSTRAYASSFGSNAVFSFGDNTSGNPVFLAINNTQYSTVTPIFQFGITSDGTNVPSLYISASNRPGDIFIDAGNATAGGNIFFGSGTTYNTKKATLFASGGFSLGNSTDPGAGKLDVANKITSGSMPVGSVIQTINVTYSTQASSNTNVYADTGLTASITPTKSTNKILVIVSQNGLAKNTLDAGVSVILLRGASTIVNDFGGYAGYNAISATLNYVGGVSISYLDSPATTSAVTYKTQFSSATNLANALVQVGGTTSTITLMEIVG